MSKSQEEGLCHCSLGERLRAGSLAFCEKHGDVGVRQWVLALSTEPGTGSGIVWNGGG